MGKNHITEYFLSKITLNQLETMQLYFVCFFLHPVVHYVVIDRSKLEADAHAPRKFECGG